MKKVISYFTNSFSVDRSAAYRDAENKFSHHEEPFSGLPLSQRDLYEERATKEKNRDYRNDENKFVNHEDPSGLLIKHQDLYNQNDPSPEKIKLDQSVNKGILSFANSVAISAAFRKPLLAINNVNTAKSAVGMKYWDGLKNFWVSKPSYKNTYSKNLLKYRTVTSLAPVTLLNIINEQEEIPPASLALINACVERIIALSFSAADRESGTRFHAINSHRFSFDVEGINLLTLTREQFDKYCDKGNPNSKFKDFGDKEWDLLQKRKQKHAANKPQRAVALFLRNFTYGLVLYAGDPLAQWFLKNCGEMIEQETGIKKHTLEISAEIGTHATLAWLTTVFDTALTKMSTGKMTAKEVGYEMLYDIEHGNIKNLMRGGAARTLFVAAGVGTIIGGRKLADYTIAGFESLSQSIKKEWEDLDVAAEFKSIFESINQEWESAKAPKAEVEKASATKVAGKNNEKDGANRV